MTFVLVASGVAAAGILIAFVALALPAGEATTAQAAPQPEAPGTRRSRHWIRERIDRPFQALVERSSQQRRLNGRLTLSEQLSRADLKLRSSEFVMIQLGFLVAGAGLTLLRFGFGPQFVIAGLAAYLLPMRYVKYRQRRRLKELNRRLPDTLGLLSNAMKAGLSLPQALDTVARSTAPPISDELARVVRETNLGTGVEQALANLVRRVGSQDLDLVVTAITIQSSVGGNLAKLLDGISHTIRQRVQVKSQIAALTAQARASGWIITLLPFIVAALLYLVTPTYFRGMVEDPIGIALLVAAVISIVIGNVLVRRIVNFKV